MGEDPPLAEIPALTTGQTAAGAARAAAEGTPGNSFRSVSTMSAINTFAVTARTTRSLPKSWVLGQVVDCPKMNLTVRTGVDGGSIVWSMSTDARLEARTTLIMLPTPEGGQFGANGTTPAAATPDGAAGKVSAIDAAQPFNRLDVTREEIAVYRSSDGAKLSSVVTDDFVLAQNAYALSPAGDQMAVVGRQSIQFYPVKLR